MTLFVNPLQFDRKDDLARYPRDQERDTQLARDAGVDVIYAPTAEAMYPAGYATYVTVEGLTDRWEGATRPGHFRGVATVCAKLFTACRPHRAYFGQKDYQQTLVMRRLVADLDLGLELVVLPTVREADGLALSSRNVALDPRGPPAGRDDLVRLDGCPGRGDRAGSGMPSSLRAAIEAQIRTAPMAEIDYVAVCDPDTLEPLTRIAAAGRGAGGRPLRPHSAHR